MTELIKIKGLKKDFQTAAGVLHILKGISTVFYMGEMVSIVGLSGAGKSTLLHILGTLDRPTEGEVLYANTDGDFINPFNLDPSGLASFRNSRVGFIFQFHYLLPEFTALENILMPGLIHLENNRDARFDRAFLSCLLYTSPSPRDS